ncbi:sigma factor [Pseudarthrobacter siccitolerans]|uniref:sigma factor n=1 Tax=Pseudarthrobacter siccitolerans TaxID=861266 RepID=UPI000678ED3E|nr:sigma factor [Pseudarthrobacter siccitolerans]
MLSFDSVIADIFDRRAEKRVSLEEERELLAAAQAGNEDAKISLFYAYAAALRNGVKWYTRAQSSVPQAADLDDVRQAVVMGLLEAIQAFDPEKHDRLAAIAAKYITNAVSVQSQDASGFSIPERTMKRFFGILRKADGNVFEAARIAPEHEMTAETFLSVLSAVRNVEGLEALTDGGEDSTGAPREIEARSIFGDPAADAEDAVLVELAFSAVDDLEGAVCRLSYGFADYEPLPDVEVAHRLGLSRPKTQRVRAGALGKMRQALGVA